MTLRWRWSHTTLAPNRPPGDARPPPMTAPRSPLRHMTPSEARRRIHPDARTIVGITLPVWPCPVSLRPAASRCRLPPEPLTSAVAPRPLAVDRQGDTVAMVGGDTSLHHPGDDDFGQVKPAAALTEARTCTRQVSPKAARKGRGGRGVSVGGGAPPPLSPERRRASSERCYS